MYKYWEVLEEMPEGWGIDKSAGSPLHGHEFITNGASVLNGQKRALLRVDRKSLKVVTPAPIKPRIEQSSVDTKPKQIIDKTYLHTVNELARKKFQKFLLSEILVDLMICEIEGWSKMEYINELKTLLDDIAGEQQ